MRAAVFACLLCLSCNPRPSTTPRAAAPNVESILTELTPSFDAAVDDQEFERLP